MIWFSCKQCGKTHSRPEATAGATIFCECGLGLIVPWESTAAAPPVSPPDSSALAEAVPDVPPALAPEPVAFGAPQRLETPVGLGPKPPRVRKRPRAGRRDPQFCFNHEEISKQSACGDCGESFCGACLVSFEGALLCGPCKNYRVKNLQRAVPASNLSILSVLIAFLTAAVALWVLPAGHAGFSRWSLVALLPQGLAAALAILALRQAARDPQTGGVPLALTGLFSSCVTGILILILTMYAAPLWT
jgi:hypothetical protein